MFVDPVMSKLGSFVTHMSKLGSFVTHRPVIAGVTGILPALVAVAVPYILLFSN